MLMCEPRRCYGLARGFTLVELIIVLVILGTMLALGIPALATWIKNSQVRTTAEVLQTGLRSAGANAAQLNRRVIFSFTDAEPSLNAAAAVSGKNWSMQTIAQFGEPAARYLGGGSLGEASNVAMAGNPVAVSSICFDSNGRVVMLAGCDSLATAIDLSTNGSDRPLRVTFSSGGQIRICDPNRPARSATTPDGC